MFPHWGRNVIKCYLGQLIPSDWMIQEWCSPWDIKFRGPNIGRVGQFGRYLPILHANPVLASYCDCSLSFGSPEGRYMVCSLSSSTFMTCTWRIQSRYRPRSSYTWRTIHLPPPHLLAIWTTLWGYILWVWWGLAVPGWIIATFTLLPRFFRRSCSEGKGGASFWMLRSGHVFPTLALSLAGFFLLSK